MARLGEKRVSELLNYEKDIKGKRLIRLIAGVGSGKNYWIVKLSQEYPDLRILLITSRVNVANAQAIKMGAGKFLDIDCLIDNNIWGKPAPESIKRVACTNARIERFVKETYDPENHNTYLWNKFDLIVLDEAHSLSSDATFAESSFYVEKLLKHTYNSKAQCDIVLMTGTPDPIDWLFEGKIKNRVTTINIYNECIHLEPDVVRIAPVDMIIRKIKEDWEEGRRIIYFANHRNTIGELAKKLIKVGIPVADIGFSFNYDKNKVSSFPKEILGDLESHISDTNDYLVTTERLPEDVKILFSTSKNKEGISIIDDDVYTVYVESLSKTDAIQMAGRVRGNAESGKGITNLVIVYNAKQHKEKYHEFADGLNRNCLDRVNDTYNDYKKAYNGEKLKVMREKAIEIVHDMFSYIRYNPFTDSFDLYMGRIVGQQQQRKDKNEFLKWLENFNEDIYPYGYGHSAIKANWFPYSKLYYYEMGDEMEMAKQEFTEFLQTRKFLNIKITRDDRELVEEELHRLGELYEPAPNHISGKSRFGRTLKKYGYSYKEPSHGVYYVISKIE